MSYMVEVVLEAHRVVKTVPSSGSGASAPSWTAVAATIAAGASTVSACVAAWALLLTSSRAKQAVAARAKVATVEYWRSTFDERMRLRRILPYEHADEFASVIDQVTDAYTPKKETVYIPAHRGTRRVRAVDQALREYLSLFETLGAGVHAGAFNAEVVWSLDGPRILKFDMQSKPYLEMRRGRSAHPDQLYAEFTWLVDKLGKLDAATKPAQSTEPAPQISARCP